MNAIARACPRFATGYLAIAILMTIVPGRSNALAADDEKIIAALDTEYQAAVEKNDDAAMDRINHRTEN